MITKSKNSQINRTVIAVIGVIVLALAGGFLGATLRGGDANAAGATSAQGAFLQEIQDRGVLRVGVAISPPQTIELEDGTYGGPNLIPLENLAEELGVKFETVPAEWKNIVAGLQAGRYDFAANLDRTVERGQAIQFTDPVFEYPSVFVVKADSPYVAVQDLIAAGKPLAVIQGAADEPAFARQYPEASMVPTDSFSNMLNALKADRVIGYLAGLDIAGGQVQNDPSLKIILPSPQVYKGMSAYGVPATADYRSLQLVNIAIERAQNEGQLQKAFEDAGFLSEDQLASSGLLKR